MLLLVWQVASLDAISATVLIYLTVKLTTLPAILLKEAIDSYTARVVSIAITIYNLQPLELHYSRNVGVNRAPYQEQACSPLLSPLLLLLSCRHQGCRWHVALTVVRKQLGSLGQGHVQRLGQQLNLCHSQGVCMLLLLLQLTLVLLLVSQARLV